MTGGLLIQNGMLHGSLPSIDAGLLLEIAGTASGKILHAQDLLRSSGGLVVQGNGLFKGNLTARGALTAGSLALTSLANCDTIDTDANGNLTCGTDAVGGAGSTFGSGNVLTIAGPRYVDVAGDTMTGLLVISRPSNAQFLQFANTTNSVTTGLYVGTSSPNGVISAGYGSIFIDQTNGAIYAKTYANGTSNGWSKMSSATGSILPGRATLWHDESKAVSGAGLTTGMDASQFYSTFSYQSPASSSDAFTNGFSLRPGSYTFSVLGLSNNTKAMIDWYIDGNKVIAQQDWYSTTGTYNVVKTATVTVAGNGEHVLKGQVNGKNPNSAGYNLLFTKMWFSPAADTQAKQ